VPTRLLDWSRHPLVAAYFACKEVARATAFDEKLGSETGKSAVFALRAPIAFDRLGSGKKGEPVLREVTAPYDSNPNLRAQRGTFTLVAFPGDAATYPLPTIEELIRAWRAQASLSPNPKTGCS
jgi:hypothetical protein